MRVVKMKVVKMKVEKWVDPIDGQMDDEEKGDN